LPKIAKKMTIKMLKTLRGVTLCTVMLLTVTSNISAQCAMCKATIQSNLQAGGSQGIGMNAGIFILLITPYIIVGGIAYIWYRNRKKGLDDTATVELRELNA
jgi:hypothetical protein